MPSDLLREWPVGGSTEGNRPPVTRTSETFSVPGKGGCNRNHTVSTPVRTSGDTTAGKDRRLAHAFRIMGETGGGTFGPAAERSP